MAIHATAGALGRPCIEYMDAPLQSPGPAAGRALTEPATTSTTTAMHTGQPSSHLPVALRGPDTPILLPPRLHEVPLQGNEDAHPPDVETPVLVQLATTVVYKAHNQVFAEDAVVPESRAGDLCVLAPEPPPPGLLGHLGPVRPTFQQPKPLCSVHLHPAHLLQPPVCDFPASQLRLYAAEDRHPRSRRQYSVLDEVRHHIARRAAEDWTLTDYVQDALQSTEAPAFAVQVLEMPIPALDEPQVVLTTWMPTPGALAMPFDFRALQGGVCTLVVTPGLSVSRLWSLLDAQCSARLGLAGHHLTRDFLFFQSAKGDILEELPASLLDLQWLRVLPDPRGRLELHMHAASAMSTTVTTTGVQPTGVPGTVVSVVLVGGGTSVRLNPQPIASLDLQASLAELLLVLAIRGRVPPNPTVMVAASCPRLPPGRNHLLFTFLVYDGHSTDVHILYDTSADASLLHMMTLDAGTQPEHTLMEAQRRRGRVVALNGVVYTACNRPLVNGDLVQLQDSLDEVHVNTLDALYFAHPPLRLFAFPISLAHFPTQPATLVTADAQHRCRETISFGLGLRLAEHQRLLGSPGPDARAVLVYGPHHPPLQFYIPVTDMPNFLDTAEYLSGFVSIFPPGTTWADADHIAWLSPFFISVPEGANRATILLPSPHSRGYLQLSVPRGVSLAGLQLPVMSGYVLEFPPVARDGAVIQVVRRAGRAASGTSTGTAGTSLIQLSASVRVNRCDGLSVQRQQEGCTCTHGQVACPDSAEVDTSLGVLPANAALCPTAVPTPLGRRRLQRPHASTSDAPPSGGRVLDPGSSAALPSRLGPGGPVVLDLCSLLTGPSCPTESTLHFPVPAGMPDDLFCWFHLAGFCREVPAGFQVHPAAARLLQHLPIWDPATCISALMLYTDGSYKHGRSAWAVVAFVFAQDQWRWAGYSAAPLDPRFASGSVFEAEVMAQFVARCTAATVTCPVAVFYDSTSAAAVSEGSMPLRSIGPIQAAATSITAYLRVCGRPIVSVHIASHEGNEGNELADSIAKAHLSHEPSGMLDPVHELVDSILRYDFDWLWIRAPSLTGLPSLDEHGDSYPIQGRPLCVSPELADYTPPDAATMSCAMPFALRLATYNTLSLKTALQKRCLHAAMWRYGLSVLALQETKVSDAPVQLLDGVLRVAGPCQGGVEGVQLWFRMTGSGVPWTRSDFSVRFATERLLEVVVNLPGAKLVFFAGHAHPSTASADQIAEFWRSVRCRLCALPPEASPVLLLDANARFSDQDGQLVPLNDNAVWWQRTLHDFQLSHTGIRDSGGCLLRTWISPMGQPACLDYIAYPAPWADGIAHVRTADFLDQHAGIDHFPVLADLSVCLQRRPVARPYNVEAMHTPQGRAIIHGIMREAPQADWGCDVDTHLQRLHAYFHSALAKHFLDVESRPRHPAISPGTWSLLRQKRCVRRTYRRRRQWEARQVLWGVFQAWKCGSADLEAPMWQRLRHQIKAADQRAAYHVRFMRTLQADIRTAFQQDCAEFTRRMWHDVRGQGPGRFAHLVRSIVKSGRGYKPARLAVNLRINGLAVDDPAQVADVFAKQFALNEQAQDTTLVAMQETRARRVPCADRFLADQLPSLVTLAAAFASQKSRKAPGISRLPADFYAADPLGSALVHAPLLLKALTRNQLPFLWGGCLSVPLLKPGKPAHDPQSYRSIALQEPAAKALHKACRPQLCQGFEGVTLEGLGGARPDIALNLPALTVQAAMAHARRFNRSISLVFLDGVAAFYATSRHTLFPHSRHQLENHLLQGPYEEQLVRRFLLHLPQEGALAQAEIPAATAAWLQTSLSCTWFTTSLHRDKVQQTVKGTVPGAPLADILFQYVFRAAVATIAETLNCEGHSFSIVGEDGTLSAEPTSWLDDLTLIVQADAAMDLARATVRAAQVAEQCLAMIGIQVNYAPNKTEAVMIWRGPGSRTARHHALVTQAGNLSMDASDGTRKSLRCVDAYTHLGTVRNYQASARADIQRRAQLARAMYQPLRARILRNPCLTVGERRAILCTTVLAAFTHGVGTWALDTALDLGAFCKHYMMFVRGAVQPLFQVPCRRLADAWACAAVGVLLPQEALALARIRALSQVALRGSVFLQHLLVQEQSWLLAVFEDLRQAQSWAPSAAVSSLLTAGTAHVFHSWPLSKAQVGSWLKRCRRACLDRRIPLHAKALAKAHMHRQVVEAGCHFIKMTLPAGHTRCVPCPECGQSFSTAAACAAHRSRMHNIRALASFGFGTACQVCSREFWSAARLREHLRRSQRCARIFEASDIQEQMPPAAAPLSSQLPPVPLIGPVPWWATMEPGGPTDPPRQPPSLPGIDFPLMFGEFHSRMDFTAYFSRLAKVIEAGAGLDFCEYLDDLLSSNLDWRLAGVVAQAVVQCRPGIVCHGPKAGYVPEGFDFVLIGPVHAIRSLADQDLTVL